MPGNRIQLTDAGRAALVASGNTGTTTRRVTQIGLSTAPFAFKPDMAALPSELKRITTFGGANVALDTVHVVIEDDSTDRYTLYAFGLYLDNGVLFGVYVQDMPILEKASASMMLLASDVVFTSIDASKLEFGPTTFLNPPATTEVQGVIELATQAEVDAGTDAVRALTPKTAANRYAPLTGATFSGPVKAAELSTDGPAVVGSAKIQSDTRMSSFSVANFDGLSIEATDSSNVTKKNIGLAPWGGKVLVGTIADDGIGLLQVAGPVTAQTPPIGDSSKKLATTEWVIATVATALVGQIVMEARTTARAGFLKLNGAVLNRADYPLLWAYAQASGALVTEAQWGAGNFGCFSSGNGSTTFRIPEVRGEYMRFWDDGRGVDAGRGIGSWQDSQNRSHAHGAGSSSVGDHVHSAWTDVQGWHDHGDRWNHAFNSGTANGSDGAEASDAGGGWRGRTESNGNHGHNVGIGAAGAHAHAITINPDGGHEVRVRSLAFLAMIRAY
ncbi:phage tail protein [Burkholderia ubonensis]|uniref:phage tail protein n=1 Tax=Burkholderia ubonensis TaxID=101571 RepID=UPI00075E0A0D|nr:phage tail protein [Burkholderia ubonensis]KVP22401.1 phage tail protein [Burkholderia ubonensis]